LCALANYVYVFGLLHKFAKKLSNVAEQTEDFWPFLALVFKENLSKYPDENAPNYFWGKKSAKIAHVCHFIKKRVQNLEQN
jgi:hypothetical protein